MVLHCMGVTPLVFGVAPAFYLEVVSFSLQVTIFGLSLSQFVLLCMEFGFHLLQFTFNCIGNNTLHYWRLNTRFICQNFTRLIAHLTSFCVFIHIRALCLGKLKLRRFFEPLEDIDSKKWYKLVEERENAIEDLTVKFSVSFLFWSGRRKRRFHVWVWARDEENVVVWVSDSRCDWCWSQRALCVEVKSDGSCRCTIVSLFIDKGGGHSERSEETVCSGRDDRWSYKVVSNGVISDG